MRNHYNTEEQAAAEFLDWVRAGGDATPQEIWEALRVTGDAIGLRDFD